MDHARALGDSGNTNGYSFYFEVCRGNLRPGVGGHDGAGHLLQVTCGGAQGSMQCGEGGGQLFDRKGHADDAGRRGEDGMRVTAEERACAGAALLRGGNAGLTGGAVGIAGIDQRDAETMLTAFQVALADDQRRGDYFVAGEHGGGCGRLVGHRAGKIRIAAGF